VELTRKGEDDIGEPDEIAYRLDPSAGTDIDTRRGSANQPPDLDVTVSRPGRYTLTAIYKGRTASSAAQ
jgi:hypothetical protein